MALYKCTGGGGELKSATTVNTPIADEGFYVIVVSAFTTDGTISISGTKTQLYSAKIAGGYAWGDKLYYADSYIWIGYLDAGAIISGGGVRQIIKLN